jgi:hypothetical protein
MPYTIMPTPVLLVLAAMILIGLALALAPHPRTIRLLFVLAVAGAVALYAGLVLAGKFPPRFGNHYYAAYSGAFLTLIASLGSIDSKRRATMRLLLVLAVLSGSTYLARLSYDIFVRVPRDRAAFNRLFSSDLVLSDALLPGHVLRLATHLQRHTLIVRLPERRMEHACPDVPGEAVLSRVALVVLPTEYSSDAPRDVATCLGRSASEGPLSAGWLRFWFWPRPPIENLHREIDQDVLYQQVNASFSFSSASPASECAPSTQPCCNGPENFQGSVREQQQVGDEGGRIDAHLKSIANYARRVRVSLDNITGLCPGPPCSVNVR